MTGDCWTGDVAVGFYEVYQFDKEHQLADEESAVKEAIERAKDDLGKSFGIANGDTEIDVDDGSEDIIPFPGNCTCCDGDEQ
jgi:hypothetical protein